MLSYREALEFLFPRTTTIKFGLERTERLLAAVGDPHRLYPTIHVGGTNGKGSVAHLVGAALGRAGWRVGLYTSPHLVSFRERIRVDGRAISEDAVAAWTQSLRPVIEREDATFFEATTAMAFADFAARGAEIAVIEVGLGGRLDSTNVITPLVSCITKIARDHQEYLGETLPSIAREKAAIAKPGVPLIVGETDPEIVVVIREEAARTVHAVAKDGVADLRLLPPDAAYPGPLRLVGKHQRRNAALAVAVLEALPPPYRPDRTEIAAAFETITIPGRLDRRGRWLFDVAHNPDGVDALIAAIERANGQVNGLVSIMADKDWPEMLTRLERVVRRGILSRPPSAGSRSWTAEAVTSWLARRGGEGTSWTFIENFSDAVLAAQRLSGTVLVTGSFHTVGDTLDLLGLAPD